MKTKIIAMITGLAIVAMIIPSSAAAVTAAELQVQINALLETLSGLQTQLAELTGEPTGTVTGCTITSFDRNLKVGMTGDDVKCLQIILNSASDTQLSAGVGSPGQETSYFGPKTKAAVIKFQEKYAADILASWGLTSGTGYVGSTTLAKLNIMLGGVAVCGNAVCESGETVTSCPADCVTGGPVCGNAVCESGETTTTCPADCPATGPISAILSFDNPASGVLVQGQATADLMHVNFTGTGTITSVTLQRSGVSDQNTISSLYLYDGTTRLTDGYSFNANSTITMNGLDIAVNGSKVISVKTDISSSCISDGTCGTIAVALTGYTANGAVSSANVMGNVFNFISGTTATAYMTNNTASSTADINAGTTQFTMWSDTIQINTRTVQLKAMNFKIIGSAPTNALANIKFFVDGVDSGVVATAGAIQGSNYAMFNFATPISLTTGSHAIDIRADIVAGAYRTIQLSVQQAADVTLYDPQVGVNLAIQSVAGTAFVADSGTTVSILKGSQTVIVDPTFNSLTNITAGSANAVIGKFLVHGYGEDVKVNTLYVTPVLTDATLATGTCTDAGTCTLSNLTVYFNGSQVGPQDVVWTASDGYSTFTLGSQMIIPAGQDSTLEIKADLQTSGAVNYTGGTIAVTLEGSTDNNNAQGQTSSEIIDFPGASDVSTTGLTISSASLVVSKNTALAATTVNPNTADARIGSYTLQNQSSSEATRLTTLTVALYDASATDDGLPLTSSTTPTLTNFSALRTSDTTGAGSIPIQPAASNTFSVSDVLQPGASMTIDIYANAGSEASSVAFYTKLTVASIGAVSNISDSGTAATGQTITLGAGTVQTPSLVSNTTTSTQYIASSVARPATSGAQATFNFVSTTAPSTISELKFTVTGSDANPTQTVTKICVGSACGSPAVVSGTQTVYLKGLSLAVPTGAGLTQNVLVDYAGIGIGGVASNVTSIVALDYIKYTSGGTTTALTGTGLGGADFTSVAVPTVTLVGSAPIVTVASTSVSGLNYAGVENKIGEVTIAASSKGSIKLNDIKFDVNSSNLNSSNDFALTDARIAVGSTTVTASGCGQEDATTASLIVFCEFGTSGNTFATGGNTSTQEINTDFDGYIVPANTSVTFSLFAKVTGTVTTAGSTSTVSTTVDKTGFNWDDASAAIFVADGSATAGTGAVNVGTDGTNLNAAGTTNASNIIANWPTTSYSIHN